MGQITSVILRNNLLYLLILLASIGIIDATYLTYSYYYNTIVACSIGGCETVLISNYATIFGIPIALFGLIFYSVIIMYTRKRRDFKKISQPGTSNTESGTISS